MALKKLGEKLSVQEEEFIRANSTASLAEFDVVDPKNVDANKYMKTN